VKPRLREGAVVNVFLTAVATGALPLLDYRVVFWILVVVLVFWRGTPPTGCASHTPSQDRPTSLASWTHVGEWRQTGSFDARPRLWPPGLRRATGETEPCSFIARERVVHRSKFMVAAVVTALMLSSVPTATAQAAPPARSTYTVFIAICDGAFPAAREAGPTSHARDFWHSGNSFFLVGGQWVLSGTNHVDIDESNWGIDSGVSAGTFAIRGSLLGDFDGHWAANWGKDKIGHGVGQGVGMSTHVEVDILLDDPVGPPDPPADGCGVAPVFDHAYWVISAH